MWKSAAESRMPSAVSQMAIWITWAPGVRGIELRRRGVEPMYVVPEAGGVTTTPASKYPPLTEIGAPVESLAI